MTKKTIKQNQYIRSRWLTLALLAALMGGCADAADQTDDLSTPTAGLLHFADQLKAQGDIGGATQFYARAVKSAPDNPVARRKLAAALAAQDNDRDAATQYAALVKLAPDNVDDRCAYGRVLLKLNRPAEAKDQYQAALDAAPADPRALDGLGVALDLLGDHTGAQTKYKSSLEQKPDDFATLNNLGHSYLLAGAYDDAIKVLEPPAQDPAAPVLLRRNLAEAYVMTGMDIDAARVLKTDLSSEQIKKQIARWKAARAQTATPALYADLGSFSTSDLADARNAKIKEQFAAQAGLLTFETAPEMDDDGGEPIFHARVSGFEDAGALKAFCRALRKGGAFCKAHIN